MEKPLAFPHSVLSRGTSAVVLETGSGFDAFALSPSAQERIRSRCADGTPRVRSSRGVALPEDRSDGLVADIKLGGEGA